MKKLLMIFSIMIALILSLSMVNAVKTFTVSPNGPISGNVNLDETLSNTFTITNTGDEPIDVSVTFNDLSSATEDFDFTLSTNQISGLENGSSTEIQVDITPSGVSTGVYVGSVTFTEDTNTSEVKIIEFNPINVGGPSAGSDLEFLNVTNNRLEMEGDSDDETRKRFTLVNTGTNTLTDITFDFEVLEGDEDDIDDSDIEVLGNDGDGFDLAPGESEELRIEVDVAKVEIEEYKGNFKITTDEGYEETFELVFEVTGGDLDVRFDDFRISNDIIKVTVEAGDRFDLDDFSIDNKGDIDAENIRVELDGAFEEEFSSETLATSVVTFNPGIFSVDADDNDEFDIDINIPEGTDDGTYIADLRLLESDGSELDEITFEIEVTGDVFIKEIKGIDQTYETGDNVDIEITVRNQGSQVQSAVQITATLFDIDFGNSDIIESSNTFILNVNDEKTETLRFNIPEDADDGPSTLRIEVDYDDGQLIELEEIVIDRAAINFDINSFGVNPAVAKCDANLFTFTKVENLGKYDENIKVITEIEGTGISDETSLFELEVDEDYQENANLDISTLEPGTYAVTHKIEYNGGFEQKKSVFRIVECSDFSGVVIEEIEDPVINETESGETIQLFGSDVAKNTAYLGGAILLIFVLIIISLFFL